MGSRARVVIAALGTCLACAGCGFGPGPGTSQVSVRVTRSFGAAPVGTITAARVPGSETVMRMLQRSFTVSTQYGGGYVESVDGLAGSKTAERDWFYYVNGIQASKGAALTDVHKGDHIWWDLHDWQRTQSIPAVVGSFPEPFAHGLNGQRYPTTLECAAAGSAACNVVTRAMTAAHVPVSSQLIGTGSGPDTLGLNVGTWSQLRPEVAAELIAYGPGSSGVYARFANGGRSLQLLDAAGRVVRTLGPGAGLIAATADSSSVPTWLITGTDTAGVMAAARALNARTLADHFALAVQGGHDYPVPAAGSG